MKDKGDFNAEWLSNIQEQLVSARGQVFHRIQAGRFESEDAMHNWIRAFDAISKAHELLTGPLAQPLLPTMKEPHES